MIPSDTRSIVRQALPERMRVSSVLIATSTTEETRYLADELASLGYRTQTVKTVAGVAALPDDERCGAEILDATTAAAMPPATGRGAARILVIPSGRPDEAIRALMDFGAVAFVERPVHVGVLAAILSRFCATLCLPVTPRGDDTQPRRGGEDADIWHLNTTSWSLAGPRGKVAELTRAETIFLSALAQAPGRAVSRDALIAALGHRTEYYDLRRLDTFVSRLRKKVAVACGASLPLRSIHAFGYAFAALVLVDASVERPEESAMPRGT